MGAGLKFKNGKFVPRTEEEERRRAAYFAAVVPDPEPRKMPKSKEKFIRITLAQADKLLGIKSHKCGMIFLFMLYADFQRYGKSFQMPTDFLVERGFSRATQARAILQLEQLELISVTRLPRKRPVIAVR